MKDWRYEVLLAAGKRVGVKSGHRKKVVQRVAAVMGVPKPVSKVAQYALLAQFMERPEIEVTKASYALLRPGKRCQPRAYGAQSAAFLASSEWRRLRMLVLTKRGAKCECCGATPKDGRVMNVDHVKPRKFYPELALDERNLQVLCDVCNHGKGNWDETDWRTEQALAIRPMWSTEIN